MEMWPEKSLAKNMCIISIKKKKKSFTYQKTMKGHEQIQGKTGFLCHHF